MTDEKYGIKLELHFELHEDRFDFYAKLIELIEAENPNCPWIYLQKCSGKYLNAVDASMTKKDSIDPYGNRHEFVGNFFEFEDGKNETLR